MLLLQFGLDQERTYTLLTAVLFAVAIPALAIALLRWWPHAWAHAGWGLGCGAALTLIQAGQGTVVTMAGGALAGGVAAWQFRLAGWCWLANSGTEVALSPARMRWRGSHGGHLSATRTGLRYTLDPADHWSLGPARGRSSCLAWTEITAIETGYQWGAGIGLDDMWADLRSSTPPAVTGSPDNSNADALVAGAWDAGAGDAGAWDADALRVPAVRVVVSGGTQLVMGVRDPSTVAGACRLRQASVLVGALRPPRLPPVASLLIELAIAVVPIVGLGCWGQSLSDRQRAWVLVGLLTLVLLAPVLSAWQLRQVRQRFAQAGAAAATAVTGGATEVEGEIVAPVPKEWEPSDFPPRLARDGEPRDRVSLAVSVALALALVAPLLIFSRDADAGARSLCWGTALLLMGGALYGIGRGIAGRSATGRMIVGLLGLACCAGVALTAVGVWDIVRSDAAGGGVPASVVQR